MTLTNNKIHAGNKRQAGKQTFIQTWTHRHSISRFNTQTHKYLKKSYPESYNNHGWLLDNINDGDDDRESLDNVVP